MGNFHASEDTPENIAQTLAKEMKSPVELLNNDAASVHVAALPPGWKVEQIDQEEFRDKPRRKRGIVQLTTTKSFIDYVKRQGSLAACTVWCRADYARGKIGFSAIINDHGEAPDEQNWRDHRAYFNPEFSEEWKRWTGSNGKGQPFTQFEFANFVEENNKDIAAAEGMPTGAQMLEMALNMEANQDVRFKSAIRLQNGGVDLNYMADDDAQTITRMKLFERFAIGIPVFLGGEPYRIDARLRYRVRDAKLTFWYELVRPDLILAAATASTIEAIQAEVGMPFFFGDPG